MTATKDVSKRIRELRAIRDMTQEELAKKLGYSSRGSISRIESDERSIPMKMIPKIADALDVSEEYLMFGVIEDDLTIEDLDLIKAYHRAPPHIRKLISQMLDVES